MAVIGNWAIGPVVEHLVQWAGDGVNSLVDNNLLPLASFVVEPAKILFLNNAINHGVFSPLGAAEAAEHGKSILFMVETNPGPGLGLLLAYWFFGPRAMRPTAPGAIIIQFFGGIHEIYFPYVLMKPVLLIGVIAGGFSGLLVANILGAGLVGPPAPGSIFAYFAVTPKGFGNWFSVYADVITAIVVSFVVNSALMKFGRGEPKDNAVHRPEDEVIVGT
jgi:PTS system mannitol-specific IIC component